MTFGTVRQAPEGVLPVSVEKQVEDAILKKADADGGELTKIPAHKTYLGENIFEMRDTTQANVHHQIATQELLYLR